MTAAAGDTNNSTQLEGGTDGTLIGNTGDRIKCDIAGTSVQMISRTDVSTTVTASGSSAAFDSEGLAMFNFNLNVTAISGVGAYIQLHVQASDDNSTWVTYLDTARLTATGIVRYQGIRQAGRYYRFAWTVAGTTPSVTFTAITTAKPYMPTRKSVRFFYSDVDLTTSGNTSTVFNADDCRNVGLAFIRGADGGTNASMRVQGSLDSVTWFDQSSLFATPASSTNTADFANQSYRFYRLQVSGNTNAGTRVLDVQWSGN